MSQIEVTSEILSLLRVIISRLDNMPSTSERNEIPTPVIWENKNLLDYNASSFSKYTTLLMKVLFTEEEMAEGFLIEGASTSKKTPLDLERVDVILRATVKKYNVEDHKVPIFVEKVKKIIKTKCTDMRKNYKQSTE